MADDALVLVAQVYDEFSAPIRRMQTQLRALTDANRRSHIEGVGLAKAHGESFTRLRESVTKTSEVFKRDFAPMLERVAEQATGVRFAFMGIAGSTAAAVGAASAMSFAFAGTAYRLSALKTATGLSFNELRGLESLAPRIGTSVEALDSGFESLAGHMERLRRNSPAEIASMAASMFPEVRSKVAQLANLPREKQFEGILGIGERIKNNPGRGGGVANEKLFLEFFGLPPNFADYSKSELLKFYSVYRQQNRDFTQNEQQAAIAAQTAWLDLRQKMQSFSDYVGSAFVPVLNTGLKTLGGAFTTLESGATGWLDKIKADPSVARAWDDLSTRVGADIGSLIANLGNFDDLASRPRVLPLSVAPEWRSASEDVGNLLKGADSLAKVLDDINTHKIDWKEILNFADLDWRIEGFKEKLKPLVDWSDKMAKWNPFGAAPPVDSKNPEGPTGPSVFDRLRALLNPPAPPTAPIEQPAPLGRPARPVTPTPAKPWESMPTFSQLLPQANENSLISRAAFMPGAGGQAAGSSSRGDAVAIIAAGTRRGVLDGMTDFWQMMRGLAKGGGGGFSTASYEPGGGGSGGGTGGLGGSLRGTGGGGGAGADGAPDASGGGKSSRRFMDELARIESSNKNIYSKTDPDVAGPNSRSQGFFQINTPTWRDFAKRAGVDLAKYPNAMSAPRDVQEKVASVIPLSRFGPRTQRMLRSEFGPLDVHKPVGQLGPQDASSLKDAAAKIRDGLKSLPPVDPTKTVGTLTSDYAGLRLKSQETTAGGAVERGLDALARHEQESEGRNFNMFSALRDRFHIFENPNSFHNRGLAFDATTKAQDYDAARERMRSYLNKLGLKEGDMQGRSGDYAIEPGTYDHIHAQFNSREASERYYAMVTSKADKYAALHDRPPMQGQHELAKHGEALREIFGHRERKDRSLGQEVRREPGSLLRAADARQAAVGATTHRVSGEASLKVALGPGLIPNGGNKSKGSLFKERIGEREKSAH